MSGTKSKAWESNDAEGSVTFLGMEIKSKNAAPKNPHPFGMAPVQKKQGELLMSKFVSRATLESNDGIFFKDEKEKDLSAQDRAEMEKHPDLAKLDARGAGMSLYEQLQARKEEKEAEQMEKRALAFAPPKALDDEDMAHYDAIAEDDLRRRKKEASLETGDRAAYKLAIAQSSLTAAPRTRVVAQKKKRKKENSLTLPAAPARILVKRRRRRRKEKEPTKIGKTPPPPPPPPPSAGGLVDAGYGSSSSDSDSDSEEGS